MNSFNFSNSFDPFDHGLIWPKPGMFVIYGDLHQLVRCPLVDRWFSATVGNKNAVQRSITTVAFQGSFMGPCSSSLHK